MIGALVLAVGLTASSCSSSAEPAADSSPTAAATSASPTARLAGPEAYLAAIRKSGLGDKDLSGQDGVLLHLGKTVCDGLSTGDLDYADLISAVQQVGAKNHATTRQATVLVNASVRNLCPEHTDLLPAGAP